MYRTILLSFLTSEHIGNKQDGELFSIDHKLAEKQLNDKQIRIVLSIVQSSGHPKYQTLSKLIKNVLIISHGNADVKRGFSTSGNILIEERTLLLEKSINDLRVTYDVVQFLGYGSVHKMSTNIDMLRAVQKSAALYKEEALKIKALVEAKYQGNEQREKMKIEKKKLSDQEQQLMPKYQKLQLEQKTAQLLFEEGYQHLQNSLN